MSRSVSRSSRQASSTLALATIATTEVPRALRNAFVTAVWDLPSAANTLDALMPLCAFFIMNTSASESQGGSTGNASVLALDGSGGGVRQLFDNMASVLESLPEDAEKRAEVTEILDELMEGVLSTTGHLSGEISQRIGNEIMIDPKDIA